METPTVVYEDDYILALNKPSGYVVNDSNTISDAPSLQNWIEKNYKFEISQNKSLRNGIVHRLDKPTSGVILIAKSAQVFSDLQKQFFDRKIEKVYIALVHASARSLAERGTINEKMGRLPWKRTKFGIIDSGREAITEYLVSSKLVPSDYSLLELYPKTGRTHQLRVHLKHIGHPIVGDALYAGRKTARADLKQFGRLMLHAWKIKFTHPITKNKLNLESPLPKEFNI